MLPTTIPKDYLHCKSSIWLLKGLAMHRLMGIFGIWPKIQKICFDCWTTAYCGNPRVSIFLNTFYRFFLDFPQTYWVLRWSYREFALISNSHYLPLVDRVTELIWINSERRMSWLDLLLHTSTYYYGNYMHRIMHWMVGVRDVRHVSISSETFVVYPSNRMIFTTHTRKEFDRRADNAQEGQSEWDGGLYSTDKRLNITTRSKQHNRKHLQCFSLNLVN